QPRERLTTHNARSVIRRTPRGASADPATRLVSLVAASRTSSLKHRMPTADTTDASVLGDFNEGEPRAAGEDRDGRGNDYDPCTRRHCCMCGSTRNAPWAHFLGAAAAPATFALQTTAAAQVRSLQIVHMLGTGVEASDDPSQACVATRARASPPR